jgi:hypothetical protein
MPNANPASPHKKAANAVLKASIGLAKAGAEFPKDTRDELLLGEEAVAARDDVREQAHHGLDQAPKGLHGEGRVAVCAPLVLAVLRPLPGVPLGGGGPGGGSGSPAVPCRARVDDLHVPHLELVCEHVEDASPGFGTP